MATDPYALTPRQLVWLAVVQSTIQGILVSLFATFITSKRKRHPSLKVYVGCVNLLALAQTTIHVMQAFDALDPGPPRAAFILVSPVLTAITSTSVQAFYIHRCWQIFKKNILPIVPFLLCLLTALVSGILLGVYSMRLGESPDLYQNKIVAMTIWAFSSFILDLCMTLTTIVFLYRSRKDFSEYKTIFGTIWQVMWASAVPPLILMFVVVFNEYIFPERGFVPARLSSAMTGKFFALSLMITLVGQGHVRRMLEQAHRSHLSDSTISRADAGAISVPVFAPTTSTVYEMERRRSFLGTQATEGGMEGYEEEDANRSHRSITKPDDPESQQTVHNIQLSSQP